jgi:ferric-chelate reductase
MNYQITLDADSLTRNSLTYYGAWPMMIVWGLDRFIRFVSLVTVNFGYLNPWSSQNTKKELDAIVEVLSPQYVRVSLNRSKHFHWRPGQNAYLCFPSISTFAFESHPFTISTIDDDSKSEGSILVFILRVQHGFTKKLHNEASSDTTYKVFLNGPYGSPPLLIGYQTVILIAGSFLLSLHVAFLIIHLL